MSRLIDAEIAYDKIAEQETSYYMDMDGVQAGLDETPTVDAVPVVRCKECKHCVYDEQGPGIMCCPHIIRSWVTEDFYCAYGERRSDDKE